MSNQYHNTTNQTGQTLEVYEGKAGSQTSIILNWFKRNPEVEKTPSEIHRILFSVHTPLTSVRRSMSNLSKEGCQNLIKCDTMRQGMFGRLEHCWKLNNDIDWND